ncbi:hypothetical protein FRC19_008708 [Serendipita sp. 401]|nr:hypothetical protein FRC19_008708 [Serendipita sp. 401]
MATVQALVSSCVIIPQAIGPALGTSTFAFAIQHREILRGNFFWVSMLVLSVIAVLHSLTLRESSHDRREEESRDTSRQEII